MSNKPLDYYLNAQYTIVLEPGLDGWYGGEILEIPECIAQGKTPEETLSNLEEARRLLIEWNYEEGKEIPVPAIEQDYSRSYLLRMPPSLHRQLKKNAEREGISLNQHINLLLQRNSSIEITIKEIAESYQLKSVVTSPGSSQTLIGVGLYLETIMILVGQEQENLFKNFKVQFLPWDGNFFQFLRDRQDPSTVSMIIGNNAVCERENERYNFPLYEYHATLSEYKGFAIMVHNDSTITSYADKANTNQDMAISDILKDTLRQLKGKSIIAADKTDHLESLEICLETYGSLKRGEYNIIGDYEPNEGLRRFLNEEADAYVGGIPQRIIALSNGKKELISQSEVRDLDLTQVNGLITNEIDERISKVIIHQFLDDWANIVNLIDSQRDKYLPLLIEKFNKEFKEYSQKNQLLLDDFSKFEINPKVFMEKYANKFMEDWEDFPTTYAQRRKADIKYHHGTRKSPMATIEGRSSGRSYKD